MYARKREMGQIRKSNFSDWGEVHIRRFAMRNLARLHDRGGRAENYESPAATIRPAIRLSISAAPYPASARTARVCSPARGAGRLLCGTDLDHDEGTFIETIAPSLGCSIVRKNPTSRRCGSLIRVS